VVSEGEKGGGGEVGKGEVGKRDLVEAIFGELIYVT
jgi:hypothetical protein